MSSKEMLINYVPGEECRIAILQDRRLEELYQERASSESHVGNIYKGKVLNVEPAIQAAFIDFGLERNGFLHISDLHPKYFPGDAREEFEQVGHKTPRRDRPPIQKCLRRNQEILVQVLKEGIGTKGPTLTSYLSIPGRFLVMMPHMERHGVSRKVEDDEARREMRDILDELNPPREFGFIVRTAGIGRPKTDIKRDLAYLLRLWKRIDQRMGSTRVGELYTESDLVIRTIRDVFSTEIDRVIVDDARAAQRAADFLAVASPRSASKVFLYEDPLPLFHRYDIERQIESINARSVPLPSGGSLVIDSTEALVAIDVNSGKSRDSRDAESNAYHTNLEAADEICRQLRLRDLGGVIVNDLIDMRSMKHRKEIEARFRANLKNDRARTRINAISQFGILEMTRQRMRPSLKKSIYMECPHCQASGHVKTAESVVLEVMRRLALALQRGAVTRVELTVSPDVAFQLLNRKRSDLVDLEHRHDKHVLVRVNGSGPIDFIQIVGLDARGGAVEAESIAGAEAPKLTPVTTALPEEELVEDEPSPSDAQTPIQPHEDETPQTDQAAAPLSEDSDREQPRPDFDAPEDQEGAALDAPDSHDYPAHELRDAADSPHPQAQREASPSGQVQPVEPQAQGEGQRRRRRRRRGRRGRGGNASTSAPQQHAPHAPASQPPRQHAHHAPPAHSDDEQPSAPEQSASPVPADHASPPSQGQNPPLGEGTPRRKRRRRGGRRHRRRGQGGGAPGQSPNSAPAPGSAPGSAPGTDPAAPQVSFAGDGGLNAPAPPPPHDFDQPSDSAA